MSYIKRRITTTLPTTLNVGEEVYYQDANGVLTLWVGRADGSAWPAVGYKEWVGIVSQTGTSAPTATVIANTLGTITLGRLSAGSYTFDNAGFVSNKAVVNISPPPVSLLYPVDNDFFSIIVRQIGGGRIIIETLNGDAAEENGSGANNALTNTTISIRVYP